MTTKYDAYYEREIAYSCSKKELGDDFNYLTEELLLAYIRSVGIENFSCLIPYTCFDESLFTKEKHDTKIECRMVNKTDSNYNPLIEEDALWENHFFHPYKIVFTPIDKNEERIFGREDAFYFMDFLSLVREGQIIVN